MAMSGGDGFDYSGADGSFMVFYRGSGAHKKALFKKVTTVDLVSKTNLIRKYLSVEDIESIALAYPEPGESAGTSTTTSSLMMDVPALDHLDSPDAHHLGSSPTTGPGLQLVCTQPGLEAMMIAAQAWYFQTTGKQDFRCVLAGSWASAFASRNSEVALTPEQTKFNDIDMWIAELDPDEGNDDLSDFYDFEKERLRIKKSSRLDLRWDGNMDEPSFEFAPTDSPSTSTWAAIIDINIIEMRNMPPFFSTWHVIGSFDINAIQVGVTVVAKESRAATFSWGASEYFNQWLFDDKDHVLKFQTPLQGRRNVCKSIHRLFQKSVELGFDMKLPGVDDLRRCFGYNSDVLTGPTAVSDMVARWKALKTQIYGEPQYERLRAQLDEIQEVPYKGRLPKFRNSSLVLVMPCLQLFREQEKDPEETRRGFPEYLSYCRLASKLHDICAKDFSGVQRDLDPDAKGELKDLVVFPDWMSTCSTSSMERVRDHIMSANKFLDVCVFGLSHQMICNAILCKMRQNVPVRVIVDHDHSWETAAMFSLQMSCVPCRHNSNWQNENGRVSSSMHHKFVIVDGKTLLTGSCNLTTKAEKRSYEALIVMDNPFYLRGFMDLFERLWKKFEKPFSLEAFEEEKFKCALYEKPLEMQLQRRFGTGTLSDNEKQLRMVAATDFKREVASTTREGQELFVFPEVYDAEKPNYRRMLKYIEEAKAFLDVCVFMLTDHEIALAIKQTFDRKVHVRIICDKKSMRWRATECLVRYGVPCCVVNRGTQVMHHKFAIVDGETLLCGSFNWTHRSAHINDETVLVLHDQFYLQHFMSLYEALWKECEWGEISTVETKQGSELAAPAL